MKKEIINPTEASNKNLITFDDLEVKRGSSLHLFIYRKFKMDALIKDKTGHTKAALSKDNWIEACNLAINLYEKKPYVTKKFGYLQEAKAVLKKLENYK